MVWTPRSMTEQQEADLITAIRGVVEEIGVEEAQKFLRSYLLARKDRLLKAPKDNPARIKLEEILRNEEQGFE
jgi:hypothetical protein